LKSKEAKKRLKTSEAAMCSGYFLLLLFFSFLIIKTMKATATASCAVSTAPSLLLYQFLSREINQKHKNQSNYNGRSIH